MKAFEEYKNKVEVKTISYLTINGAFDAGREVGWRAALECLLVYLENHTDRGKDIVQVENHIKRELNVKT